MFTVRVRIDSLKFTFHYVSIKSDLLSTLFRKRMRFTFHYVSIKSNAGSAGALTSAVFTFHYVSIKSKILFKKTFSFM